MRAMWLDSVARDVQLAVRLLIKQPVFTATVGTTLAVCLAAQAFEETEFVTDRCGAQLADTLGWQFHRIATQCPPCAGTDCLVSGKVCAEPLNGINGPHGFWTRQPSKIGPTFLRNS